MRAYLNLHRFDTGHPFKPWLMRIVANTAKNRRRAAGRRDRVSARAAARRPEVVAASADDLAFDGFAADDVVAAVGSLDERERLVIAYRYFAGLNEQETAMAMHCPTGTVKSRHARALARLRAALGEHVQGGGDA